MKKIITISRQYGAGGSTIGLGVAERLGYYFCDKDMIMRAAMENGNLTADEIRYFDEKVPTEFGIGQSLFDFYNKPLDERLFNAQRDAIRKVAEKGKCVIIGRNANIILKEFDNGLHVFLSASERFRLNRMMEKTPGITEAKMLERLHSVDKARKKYCMHYTGTEFGNADFYDISLRTSSLGIDRCIDIICDIAQHD